MEIKDNTLFRRYEFKYLLNSKIANQIKDEAKKFMLIDSYAKKGEDQSYFVRSLYFDNDEYQNFYDKVDGIRSRKKFRLRTYEKKLSKNNLIFLEIKGRHLERTFKKRTQIQSNHLKFFYDNRELPKLLSFYPNNDLVKDFVFTYLKTKIRPKVLIDYTRQPFINKYGLYFRLTFDSNLFSNKSKELFINESKFSKLNIKDVRANFYWNDATSWSGSYDTVVMNPPFHSGRSGNPDLGRAFIINSARNLRPKGDLWMVANRHLPYEKILNQFFENVSEILGNSTFKLFQASRPKRN